MGVDRGGRLRFDERASGSSLHSNNENSLRESEPSSADVEGTRAKRQLANVASCSASVETGTSSQSGHAVGDATTSNADTVRSTLKKEKRMECAESGQLKSTSSTTVSDHEASFSSKKRLSQ